MVVLDTERSGSRGPQEPTAPSAANGRGAAEPAVGRPDLHRSTPHPATGEAPWPARANFGRRLRYWRQVAGLTQADLGRKLAYDHSFISRVECGTRWPPRDLAVRCDNVLGTGQELVHLWRLAERERRRAISPA